MATITMTAERERALAARIRGGCIESRNELVLASQAFVRAAVAAQLRRPAGKFLRGAGFEDLVQQVNLVLLRKAGKFDPFSHHARWSTYAAYWVKAAMKEAATAHAMVRVPQHQVERRARQNRGCLTEGLGRGALGRLEAAGRAMAAWSALDSACDEGDPDVVDPRDHAASGRRWRRVAAVRRAADRLPARERAALERRLTPAVRRGPPPAGERAPLSRALAAVRREVEEQERMEVWW